MLLLDTNVVSELRKVSNGRCNANVLAWSARQTEETRFLSAMTVFEIEHGILRLERRDIVQAAALRLWLDESILPAFDGRILPFDTAVARRCAALHIPDPRPDRDAIIAATALVHGLTLATRNVRDFDGTGVRVVNPWAGEPPPLI